MPCAFVKRCTAHKCSCGLRIQNMAALLSMIAALAATCAKVQRQAPLVLRSGTGAVFIDATDVGLCPSFAILNEPLAPSDSVPASVSLHIANSNFIENAASLDGGAVAATGLPANGSVLVLSCSLQVGHVNHKPVPWALAIPEHNHSITTKMLHNARATRHVQRRRLTSQRDRTRKGWIGMGLAESRLISQHR
jgi:hypothetical protein